MVLSGGFCRRAQPTWVMHTSAPSVKLPLEYESASTGGFISEDSRVSIASSSLAGKQ